MIDLSKFKTDFNLGMFKSDICAGAPFITPFEEEGKCTIEAKKCLYYQDCLKDKGDCTKKNYVIQKLEENLVIENP